MNIIYDIVSIGVGFIILIWWAVFIYCKGDDDE